MAKVIRRGSNPVVDTSSEYAQIFGYNSILKRMIDTCVDVVVTNVSADGRYVDVKQFAGERKENGEDVPLLEYSNIPVVQFSCSSGSIKFKVVVGDIGVIFARKFNIDMPNPSGNVPNRSALKSGRLFSFSQGFFLPLSFCGNTQFDFELKSGESSVIINQGNVEVSVTGKATVNATQVFLGGEEGALPIARHNDGVYNGNTFVGNIRATSTVSKSL